MVEGGAKVKNGAMFSNTHNGTKRIQMRAGTLERVDSQGWIDRMMSRVIVVFRVVLGAMAAAAVLYRVTGI